MVVFIDPRTEPKAHPTHLAAPTTADPDVLAPLHHLCRTGSLYDVERWIQGGKPVQLSQGITIKGRRLTSALEVALEDGNHALVLLLLCNGYDPNLEPRCPLDRVLRSRRWDLLDLLLEWGADPLRVNLGELFDSYNPEVWQRFQALGIDLCAGHALAAALAYHTSNKPLFGFAKQQREKNPQIQKALNVALVHHAREGNLKGVQLCLWAGADPHTPALDVQDVDPVEMDTGGATDQDRWLGVTAIDAACYKGNAQILARLGPDPQRDNFDDLYEAASNGSIIKVLARFAPPKNVGQIISRQMFWLKAHPFFEPRSIETLQCFFDSGARWMNATPDDINHVRSSLLKMADHTFVDSMKLLATADYCTPEILQLLARTTAMRSRMKKVGLFPLPPDDSRYPYSRPRRARELLLKFGIDIPPPPRQSLRIPHRVTIGSWHSAGQQIQLDRPTLFERVWSQSVESLAKEWGLSGRGLAKACQRLKIPVPPRGYWAKARGQARVRRPPLPTVQAGEAEEIVIHARPKDASVVTVGVPENHNRP